MAGEQHVGAPPDDTKPVPPDADNYTGCCDSGCTPCIYDLYWEAMARYEQALPPGTSGIRWTRRHAGQRHAGELSPCRIWGKFLTICF